MAVLSTLLKLSLAALTATQVEGTRPLQSRGTIASSAIVGFPQTVPSGITGEVYLAYQPHLDVVNGCVPFPACGRRHKHKGLKKSSAGLNPTGPTNGDCSSSTGQIYARGGASGNFFALMYAWYMPKDEPASGLGHINDWEGVIVWLTSSTATTAANIVAVCPSAHGNWDCFTNSFTLDGTSPLVDSESIFPLDHSCGLITTVGGTQPLIAWESLPTMAQTALENIDFGSAIVVKSPIGLFSGYEWKEVESNIV